MGRFRDFLSDTLLVVEVALVLLSIFQPFLILHDVTRWASMFETVLFRQADFFTSKVTYDLGVQRGVSTVHSWSEYLNAYWLNNENWLQVGADPLIGYFLIVTFAVQILTLILGLFTLSLKPRMRIVPLVFCMFATFLLTWVFFLITGESPWRGFSYSCNLGNGYWLTLASVLCLSASIILARGRQSRIMFER